MFVMGIEKRVYGERRTSIMTAAEMTYARFPEEFGPGPGHIPERNLRVTDNIVKLLASVYRETDRVVKAQKRHPL